MIKICSLEKEGDGYKVVIERTKSYEVAHVGPENRKVVHYKLPKKDSHKDPFDRLLVWQAIQHDLTFVTRDIKMMEYIKDGLKIQLGR